MNTAKKSIFIKTALNCVKIAQKILKDKFKKAFFYEKEKNNLVTEADLLSERAIVSYIRNKFPTHEILSEEKYRQADLKSPHLWIIDPLDGTNNYAHTIPHFCISVAYAQSGEVIAGVVCDPIRKEFFHAEKEKGAFLNEKKIKVSLTKDISSSIIATGFYYDRGEIMEKTLHSIYALFKSNIRGIRRMGSAALDLCWVACGRYDGYFEYKLSPWDFAAGMLIVKEAQGICYDRQGKEMNLLSQSAIVSNNLIHKKLLNILRWD